jgi:hypothetical protein
MMLDKGFEEVDGPLQCQKCHVPVSTGLYSAEAKVLTWKCPEGHISKMENFEA